MPTPAVAAYVCAVNVPQLCEESIRNTGIVNKGYLRHRYDYEYSVRARGFDVSRRVLGRFGYMIDSMVALHHASTPLTASVVTPR